MTSVRIRRDRGSAAIWVVSCCALLTVIAGVVTVRALAVLARHRAESSADLAALAAAGQIGRGGDICAAASQTAHRNGARLRSCHPQVASDGRSGSVVVSVVLAARLPVAGERQIVASARAARLPGTSGG